jgi:hypothetical protein
MGEGFLILGSLEIYVMLTGYAIIIVRLKYWGLGLKPNTGTHPVTPRFSVGLQDETRSWWALAHISRTIVIMIILMPTGLCTLINKIF